MPQAAGKSGGMAFVALVLAYLVPGAGHFCVGRPIRGLIIFVTITATFWSGLAIGGAMTMDRYNEPWWFTAQMLSGVNGMVGWQMNERAYTRLVESMEADPQYVRRAANTTRSAQKLDSLRRAYIEKLLAAENLALVPPAETVARAYSGVAGMLNLMCVFDAVVLALMGGAAELPAPAPGEPKVAAAQAGRARADDLKDRRS